MTAAAKMPAFQFYVGDWMKCPELRACSPAARGLWVDCLCLGFESPDRGTLRLTGGAPISPAQLARMTGCTLDEVTALLAELETNGVFSRAADGAIFSRRMAADERRRQQLRADGQKGGRPKRQPTPEPDAEPTPNQPQTQAGNHEGKQVGNQNAGSSSSSSSSASAKDPPTSQRGDGGDATGSDRPTGRSRRAKAAAGDPPGFAEFWAIYPLKVGRKAAAKAYADLRPTPELRTAILAGARRYAAHIAARRAAGDLPQVKYPQGWLSGERWTDDLPAPGTTPPADAGARSAPAGFEPAPPASWYQRRTPAIGEAADDAR